MRRVSYGHWQQPQSRILARMTPIALTIAGSDPSGGAGLQADLKTFHRFGCYGMSVVTLVTAQNTRGVSRVDLLEPDAVLAQLDAVWSDLPARGQLDVQLASVIALVDFTRDNGATRVVPGSHRWPDRALAPVEQALAAPPAAELVTCAEMPAGSAVIYTGGVIHGGGANHTATPRRGAHLSYCLGWLRTEENNVLAVPPVIAATLPRQAQELLGYAVHDSIARGGGYLGMVRSQDPVELLARGAL